MNDHRRHGLAPLVLVALLVVPAAFAQTALNDLFQRGKSEFRAGSYAASLETFRRLDELSRAPGAERLRAQLAPALEFYRGANLAALGRKDEARAEFAKYLARVPNAHMDPAAYPKAVLEAFREAREATSAEAPAAEDTALATDYARFHAEEPSGPEAFPDERWAEGPIRYFLTKEEKAAWKGLLSTAERVQFVAEFWSRREPGAKDEITRRLRFADERFKLSEVRGSETDRGLVFVLLGPPSYVGLSPLRSDDADDPLQVSRNAKLEERVVDTDGRQRTLKLDRPALSAQKLQGTREAWHYRRDRLPPQVRFPEVAFEFLTKDGVGEGVLQRDRDVLMTLDAVSRTLLPKG